LRYKSTIDNAHLLLGIIIILVGYEGIYDKLMSVKLSIEEILTLDLWSFDMLFKVQTNI